jgi:hypothetical protein
MDLLEIYFEVVYPIFPFFHEPSFTRRIARAEYASKRTLFAATMALCALVSSRVQDGSVTNPKWDLEPLRALDPDVFYAKARQQLLDLTAESDINILRAHAILAIAAIQNGRIRDMHQHLGTYHTLVAMDGLHDESNWPQDVGIVEREERRRLVRHLTLRCQSHRWKELTDAPSSGPCTPWTYTRQWFGAVLFDAERTKRTWPTRSKSTTK